MQLINAHYIPKGQYSANTAQYGVYGNIQTTLVPLSSLFLLSFVCFLIQGCSTYPSCPGTHHLDQAGPPALKDPATSASRVLGIKGMRHHATLFFSQVILNRN